MKNTKIVCTIGPASESVATLTRMMKAGMNVARLNFSHGTYEYHAQLIKNIREAAIRAKQEVSLLQDLQGPRIRVGVVGDAGVVMKEGKEMILVPQKEYDGKKANELPFDFPELATAAKAGAHILIADGVMDLLVTSVKSGKIYCKVVVGGTVKSHKGINAPGVNFKTSSLTAKDKKDVVFGLSQGVDYMALSFVRSANDINELQQVISKGLKTVKRSHQPGIIAKIEMPQAVEHFDDILEVVDGIMVARGDLGIEMPISKLALVQKDLIIRCREAGKPVIVATQMLESMTSNPRPTRAEATDVANAVCEGTDAVMLSGESAAGHYPVEAVQVMCDIVTEVEHANCGEGDCCGVVYDVSAEEALASAAAELTFDKQIVAIVVAEGSVMMVQMLANARPRVPILVPVEKGKGAGAYGILRGVRTVPAVKAWDATLKREVMGKTGDCYLVVRGLGFGLEQVK